ncbi:unnamed protein product [Zymoseptoria tritici ST99CH_1A5]|uniref:CSC1/OSCA1-like 7TM region domain-containing protein n=1 Tax=Zymoseptoria tritici ST99CH_1A5 TaxID=1276529 RepID=A0A1Y6L8X5_ZYMTR|nr:unnamed protein product [Zymoseptoria tritici ST99CH_1A5]
MAELLARQQQNTGEELIDVIGAGFSNISGQSALASLITSAVLTAVIALLFCFLRPYNSVVYAPRAKHADSKHAPPPVSKGLFGWLSPLVKTKEKDLVEKVGVDAAVFMRVVRMLRNIFSILAVVGCGIIIPNNLLGSKQSKVGSQVGANGFFNRMTPLLLYGQTRLWAYVVVTYLFTAVILYFLYINYVQITRMRREYYNSTDYQHSLHARTLLLTDLPKDLRSDEGIGRLVNEVRASGEQPRTAIARNVRDLPELVEEHTETVKELEEHLAKYLKNPDRLPPTRPTCKVHKNDKGYGSGAKGQKVDAIEYLTGRIRELETQIREVRLSVDKRDALLYGFASYQSISAAHVTAYAAKGKKFHGAEVQLAPKPSALVWKNLKMSRGQRKRQSFVNSLWIGVLIVVWTVPNLLIAAFLANLSNLAIFWPAFKRTYDTHSTWWAIVQGVLAPALTMSFYFYLPAIFRKLRIKAGDVSKTSRERHVARSLYKFFVINNLIVFSIFSSVWTLIWTIVRKEQTITRSTPLTQVLTGLCGVSSYWICWMLQRNLGAAVDLSQLWTLITNSWSRRFSSPTPRSLIQLSAPQPMDYASYYNYFLFYATVAIAFAPIHPLILPVTAFYFWMDSFMKKYLLLYVLITKYESGGVFWRSIFNRMLFLTVFGNFVVAVVILALTIDFIDVHWAKLACLVPLPLIVIGFKFYCKYRFDDEFDYYETGKKMRDQEQHPGNELNKRTKGDRMAARFGHPALYRPLITPMVSSKSQHLLKSIYGGRTSLDDDTSTVAGYSDVYLDNMDPRKPGRRSGKSNEPFELVDENNLDFEHYKNRPEFRDEAGGDGELYGHAGDFVRPGTPSSAITGFTRAGTFDSTYTDQSRDTSPYGHSRNTSGQQTYVHSRDASGDSDHTRVGDGGMEYPRGYHQAPSLLRDQSPSGDIAQSHREPVSRRELPRRESRDMLMSSAAGMGFGPPAAVTPGGYGPVRYGNVPSGENTPGYASEEDTSYDYFRRGRTGR